MIQSRRGMRRMLAHSKQKYKHQVDAGALNVNMNAAVTTNVVISGVDNPLLAAVNNVQAKAKVMAIYMELTCLNTGGAAAPQVFDWCLQANPQSAIGAIDPQVIGSSSAKAYVFKSGNLVVYGSATPAKVFGLIKIPQKYARFMNLDVIYFNIRSRYANGITDGYQVKFIYKEIRG